MVENTRFRVDYADGYVDVVVGEFFAVADQAQIKRLIRFARRHCGRAEQVKLHNDIRSEIARCDSVLNEYEELRRRQQDLLSTFLYGVRWSQPEALSSAERAIKRRQNKLLWSDNQVMRKEWVG